MTINLVSAFSSENCSSTRKNLHLVEENLTILKLSLYLLSKLVVVDALLAEGWSQASCTKGMLPYPSIVLVALSSEVFTADLPVNCCVHYDLLSIYLLITECEGLEHAPLHFAFCLEDFLWRSCLHWVTVEAADLVLLAHAAVGCIKVVWLRWDRTQASSADSRLHCQILLYFNWVAHLIARCSCNY